MNNVRIGDDEVIASDSRRCSYLRYLCNGRLIRNKSGTHTEEKGESVNNRPSNATKGQEKQSAKTKKTKGKHR